MNDLRLQGCRPEPLASYLKALGILRIVAEQEDPEARGWWEDGEFVLRSRLDRSGLERLILEEYRPIPSFVPWSGSGGFFFREDKSNEVDAATGKKLKTGVRSEATAATRLIDHLVGTHTPRLDQARRTIDVCRRTLSRLGLLQAPADQEKVELVECLRSELPDAAVSWMDAAVFATGDRLSFPDLLGTGANDGNLNFGLHVYSNLQDLIDLDTGVPLPGAAPALRASLFAEPAAGLGRLAPGQFHPLAGGGANAGAGGSGAPPLSAWDYVLLMEGVVIFGAVASRRLENTRPGTLAYPFAVRATGVASAGVGLCDEPSSRNETWLPLWSSPSTVAEVRALFGEGRAKVGTRDAANAVDFARALSGLGVDRGIQSFVRYGFHQRFGKMYYAVPLGRWRVERRPRADLVASIEPWLDRVRPAARDRHAPASFARAVRGVEEAVLDLCASGGSGAARELLVALGAADSTLARSHRFTAEKRVPPVPALPPDWLAHADDGTPEFRLAASLASAGLRRHMVPLDPRRDWAWGLPDDPDVVWGDGDLAANLVAVLLRRHVLAAKGGATAAAARYPASPGDVSAFVDGAVDGERIEALLRGLALLAWGRAPTLHRAPGPAGPLPPAAFSLLSAAHGRLPLPGFPLPATPGLLARAASGDCFGATALAVRRLRGAGLLARTGAVHEPPERTRRIAAALLFPLSPEDRGRMSRAVLIPTDSPSQPPEA